MLLTDSGKVYKKLKFSPRTVWKSPRCRLTSVDWKTNNYIKRAIPRHLQCVLYTFEGRISRFQNAIATNPHYIMAVILPPL